MSNDFIFSWAENAEGRMVHVDRVPRGLQCGCICPNCHEPLLARHGDKNEHGFAHHSDTRGANLNICYMVILYKLAEQIIQTRKRIHAPSYYGIFPESDIDFVDVKVDCSYERNDKQPDVIATTVDGTQYLIEFTFDYKVQHKQAIDYKSLNCLEIDLSKQSLETVERFLLEGNADRKWLNNQNYFDSIEPRYQKANKVIEIKDEEFCASCELKDSCSGVKPKNSYVPLLIENSGRKYRICKPEQYKKDLEAYHKWKKEEEKRKKREDEFLKKEAERLRQREMEWERERQRRELEREQQRLRQEQEEAERLEELRKLIAEQKEARKQAELNSPPLAPSERTCFMCESNLSWMNRPDGRYAHCGFYSRMGVPKNTPPEMAQRCRGFKRKF